MTRTILVSIVSLALAAGSAASMELENIVGLGNVAFDGSDTSSLSATGEGFKPRLYGFGSMTISDRLNDVLDFKAGFERDPVLRNVIFTHIGFTSDYVRLSVGPFFGPFNAASSVLSAGLSAAVRLELSGIAFAALRADSSIGAGLSSAGDNVQERKEMTFGAWTPNALVSFRISTRRFTVRDSRALDIADDRTRYEFLADVYKKNVPYTANVNIGYQSLSRSYIGQLETDEDELRSVIVGFGTSVQTTPTLRVMAGIEAALYSWGADELKSPSSGTALFAMTVGATIALPKAGFAARNQQ